MNKVKLGDVCEIINGFAFKSKNYVSNGIRVIRIANVQKGYVDDTDPQFYPLESETEIKKYLLFENDLLISLTGNVGRVAILSKSMLPAALNQRVACLRMKEKSCISKEYLFQFLNSDKFENECIASSKGVAQKNLSTEWLKDYRIPLYPEEKQKTITDQLYSVDVLINILRTQQEKIDTLVKSRFVEMFGNDTPKYNTLQLKDCCEEITGGGTPSMKHPEYYGGDIPFIKSGDVKEDRISKGTLTLTDVALKEANAKLLPKDTIIVVVRSAALLREFHIAIADNPIVINQDLKAIKPTEQFTPVYLMWAIKMKKQVILGKVQTMLTSHIRMDDFLFLDIPVPPIELQNQFADFVAQTDKSKLAVKRILEKAETLKKSLMQEYFG